MLQTTSEILCFIMFYHIFINVFTMFFLTMIFLVVSRPVAGHAGVTLALKVQRLENQLRCIQMPPGVVLAMFFFVRWETPMAMFC